MTSPETGDFDALPDLPRDADGPVFAAPWEAEAFAMTVRLHAAGVFTWAEWAATLSDEIKTAQADGDPDLGNTYYRHWLAALERLVVAKDISSPPTWRPSRRLGTTPRGAPPMVTPSN